MANLQNSGHIANSDQPGQLELAIPKHGYLHVHVLNLVFSTGPRQNTYKVILDHRMTPSEREQWWAEQIAQVQSEHGHPLMQHSTGYIYSAGKLVSTTETLPMVYLRGFYYSVLDGRLLC